MGYQSLDSLWSQWHPLQLKSVHWKTAKAEAKPELFMGGNVVCCLTQSLPKNANHRVFFDNFFCSIAIMNHLKQDGFGAVTTICKDCLKGVEKHFAGQERSKEERLWVV